MKWITFLCLLVLTVSCSPHAEKAKTGKPQEKLITRDEAIGGIPCFKCHSYQRFAAGAKGSFPHFRHLDKGYHCNQCHTIRGHRAMKTNVSFCQGCHGVKSFTFASSGFASRFNHESHAKAGCRECHPGLFQMKKDSSRMTMSALYQGRYCGACHNGKKAFSSRDCARCHDMKSFGKTPAITLKTDKEGAEAVEFDLLAYFAPGMALMFLMYTVSYGGRSILAERSQGTLPRLMISPTYTAQVLGGKVLGIFFMGVAQVGILIVASAVFFQVKWGDPLGMIALILAAVFGAAGWGMLITAMARTPAQVGSTGSAIMLIFGILGGSFINLEQLPPFMQVISKITPNAWGLDGFTTLALGGTLKNLTEPIIALLIMGTVLFGIAVVLFNRIGLVQK